MSKNKKGFTLAELLISMSILGMIVTLTFSIYVRFFDSLQNIKAANLVYEEARFLMERMIKEVRSGTVDYEEYFNQSLLKNQFPDSYDNLRNESYGQNYCQYNRQFYTTGTDNEIGTFDDESTGLRGKLDPADGTTEVPPAIGILDELNNDVANPIQKDLFIINVTGDQRTFIKRTEKTDSLGNIIGKISLVKMEGKDFGTDQLNGYDPYLDGSAPGVNCSEDMGEGDGNIDTWICMDGFPCERREEMNSDLCQGIIHKVIYDPQNPEQNSFVDISPDSLDIIDLTFFVSPMDDPRRGYRNNDIQIQPNITIRLTAQAAPALAAKYDRKYNPNIVLESSVSARAYNEIQSECI